MFKKLRMWFWRKNKILAEIEKIDNILTLRLSQILLNLEALDQDKLYICYIDGANTVEVQAAKDAFNRAKGRMRWTAPLVIFTNLEIRTMTKAERKFIFRQVKQHKRSVIKQ